MTRASAAPAPRLLPRWVALCALAEFLGIGAAAIWYGGVNVLFGEPVPLLARTGVWALMTLAAVPEGLVLGGLQSRGIRWFLPETSARRLILATIAIGLLGWGIGGFIPMFIMTEAAAEAGPDPGLMATALYAGTFGLAVGAVFGFAQSWALPKARPVKAAWTLANMLGWGLGLPAIYIGAQFATEFSDWPSRIAAWGLGGLVAGALIGITTGIALLWSVTRRGELRPAG